MDVSLRLHRFEWISAQQNENSVGVFSSLKFEISNYKRFNSNQMLMEYKKKIRRSSLISFETVANFSPKTYLHFHLIYKWNQRHFTGCAILNLICFYAEFYKNSCDKSWHFRLQFIYRCNTLSMSMSIISNLIAPPDSFYKRFEASKLFCNKWNDIFEPHL